MGDGRRGGIYTAPPSHSLSPPSRPYHQIYPIRGDPLWKKACPISSPLSAWPVHRRDPWGGIGRWEGVGGRCAREECVGRRGRHLRRTMGRASVKIPCKMFETIPDDLFCHHDVPVNRRRRHHMTGCELEKKSLPEKKCFLRVSTIENPTFKREYMVSAHGVYFFYGGGLFYVQTPEIQF